MTLYEIISKEDNFIKNEFLKEEKENLHNELKLMNKELKSNSSTFP